MIASRDTDVRVALVLGWQWRRLPGGLQLLIPPEGSYFYDPADSGLQLVPAYSSDPGAWDEYVAELREHARVTIQLAGTRAWIFVDGRPFTALTVPLALCRLVLEREERQAA